MRIGIIGGGAVGQTLGQGFLASGHDVALGIRNPGSEAEMTKPRQGAQSLRDWRDATGAQVSTFAEAAVHGELVVNATPGVSSIEALQQAGAANLAGKVLIDVSNPLDFSHGFPPFLAAAYAGSTSLGEQVQAAFPEARVVKAFNTVAAQVMVAPSRIAEPHDLFLAGNDAEAKALVGRLAREAFGWLTVVDLGDIVGARAAEAIVAVWVRLWATTGNLAVNLHVAQGARDGA